MSNGESPSLTQRVINSDKSAVHEGRVFGYNWKVTVGAGASAYLEILAPSDGTTYTHFLPYAAEADGPKILIQLIEDPTTTPGTVVSAVNRRRIKPTRDAKTVLRTAPTGVSGGTVLGQVYLGGGTGSGQSTSGAQATNDNEIILNPGSLYVLKITNGGGSSADVNLRILFDEETVL